MQYAPSYHTPSIEGCALNNYEVFQHKLGPLVPRRALKNLLSLSARDGHQRGNRELAALAKCR